MLLQTGIHCVDTLRWTLDGGDSANNQGASNGTNSTGTGCELSPAEEGTLVRFPRALVEASIAQAPPVARLFARNPERDITIAIIEHDMHVVFSLAQRITVALESWRDRIAAESESLIADPAEGAEMLYSSGTTGKPKGVMIEHGNAVALIKWAESVFSPAEWSAYSHRPRSVSICQYSRFSAPWDSAAASS